MIIYYLNLIIKNYASNFHSAHNNLSFHLNPHQFPLIIPNSSFASNQTPILFKFHTNPFTFNNPQTHNSFTKINPSFSHPINQSKSPFQSPNILHFSNPKTQSKSTIASPPFLKFNSLSFNPISIFPFNIQNSKNSISF